MTVTLLLAAAYNVLWGAWVVLFPLHIFELARIDTGDGPHFWPQLWQCIGMIVGVYGVGYAIAAIDPIRHWPIVLVGLLGKILGPIGFAGALLDGTFPLRFGVTIITNDLIWWIPFGLILVAAWRHHRHTATRIDSGAPTDGGQNGANAWR